MTGCADGPARQCSNAKNMLWLDPNTVRSASEGQAVSAGASKLLFLDCMTIHTDQRPFFAIPEHSIVCVSLKRLLQIISNKLSELP